MVKSAHAILGKERVLVAPSCSFLHVPFDLDLETQLDADIKSWMAFARQKCAEIRIIADAVEGKDVEAVLADNRRILESRKISHRVHNSEVALRLAALQPEDYLRNSVYENGLKFSEILAFPFCRLPPSVHFLRPRKCGLPEAVSRTGVLNVLTMKA